jgi:hypothetical protein
MLASVAFADPPIPHTGLPHRYIGLDAQGHLPAYLKDALCKDETGHSHVQEVIEFTDGHILIMCRQALLEVVPK